MNNGSTDVLAASAIPRRPHVAVPYGIRMRTIWTPWPLGLSLHTYGAPGIEMWSWCTGRCHCRAELELLWWSPVT